MKRKSMFNSFNQETINKFIQTASLETSNSTSNGFRKINKNIGQEFKDQFNSKQSFKKLYSNNHFFTYKKPSNNQRRASISEKKGVTSSNTDRFHKNKILKEGSFRRFIQLKSNLHILPIIETRLDIVVCRLGWAKSLNEAHSLIRANKIRVVSKYGAQRQLSLVKGNKVKKVLDYSKYLLPIGSVIEKEGCSAPQLSPILKTLDFRNEVGVEKQMEHNYLLRNSFPHGLAGNLTSPAHSANSNLHGDCFAVERVTLLRYPSEKEILKLWIEENKTNKSLSYNIMVLIDKLNLQT